MRMPNTNVNGHYFSAEKILAVWNKAIFTINSNVRYDVCGTEIHFDKYGSVPKNGQSVRHHCSYLSGLLLSRAE